ncbi:hypothetical protein [Geobacter sp. AOG1]|uniref:hypothetical protein n=1 Tax=Geobacter sp. AOG1 TaxID=1566346 RepID=UPI001CC5C853|nr:hypothetical protein [Geobacter sp. AOG1]GFE57412.1 hypothetical protein AOG1_12920 [Geobacter sp. AOG1]
MEKFEISAEEYAYHQKLVAKDLKAKEHTRKAAAKQIILLQKAKEAGITVSKAEIEEYLTKHTIAE